MSLPGKIRGVDLFCGVGGLTMGLQQAGIDIAAGFDIDGACKGAYEHNTGAAFVEQDITTTDARAVAEYLTGGSATLIAGCAPCQPFSILTNGRKKDKKVSLIDEYSRIVCEVKPDYITVENVPGMARHPRFKNFLESIQSAGYYVAWEIVNANDYGVPQNRRRLVLLGSRRNPIALPKKRPGRKPTCGPILGSTPKLAAGAVSLEDPLHASAGLRPKNLRRIRASKPGGSWKDWRPSLRAPCHAKASGSSFTESYGRIDPACPAPTITTKFLNYGSGRFGHPTQNRALSLREGALLQGFPPTFRVPDNGVNLGIAARMIGNAVPVPLGRALGARFLEHHLSHEGGAEK